MSNSFSPVSRRGFLNRAGAAGAAVATWVASLPSLTEAAQEDSIPDPNHIQRHGAGGFRVLPNGEDDHDNLEWALTHTTPGGTVKLVRGTYKIGRPVVVPDFDGALVGMGANRTTITVTDELSLELWEAPGGGKDLGHPVPPPFPRAEVDGALTKTPPVYIQFYKTPLEEGEHPAARANSITLKKFGCRGSSYADFWALGDETVCIAIFNSFDWNDPEGAPEPTRQDVTVSGLLVDGYTSPIYGPFENACSCVTILGAPVLTSNYDLNGDIDGDAFGAANGGVLSATPAEGDVTIKSSTFRNCRFGPNIIGFKNGRIKLEDLETDGCKANCVGVYDVSNADVFFSDNNLVCDSFLLPPELANGETDVPSSLGCTVAIQGIGAAVGFPFNARHAELSFDETAHAAHPEAGPLGTWRPQGLEAAPQPSTYTVEANSCECTETPNTYCVHLVDAVNGAYGSSTLIVDGVRGNSCSKCETCISLEHVDEATLVDNDCVSLGFGIELHNTFGTEIEDNTFTFPKSDEGCEIRVLALGDKIDLSRVVPGAGSC